MGDKIKSVSGGKKGLPIVIGALVLVLGAGAYLLLGRGGKTSQGELTLPGGVKKEAGESGESFTGKLKDMVDRGVSLKCSMEQDQWAGVYYVKGKKAYAEITQEGRKAFMIMKDNCMWNWDGQTNQGVKTCFEEDIFETDQEGSVPTEAEYHCSPAVFTDAKFDLPSGVNFMDIDELMQMGQ